MADMGESKEEKWLIDISEIIEQEQQDKIKGHKLISICEKFVRDNKVYSDETVCQSDHVIENAYVLMMELFDVVGYYDPEETD